MINKRMDEARIDASLDAFLHGAREGDARQARQLHELLDRMLTEQEGDGGRFWLTDHGKQLLANMHRQLSHCGGEGEQFHENVLNAVQLKPSAGGWEDTCSYLHDLRLAVAVADELCWQRDAGTQPDLDIAVRKVAERDEFVEEAARIRQVYEHIATTIGGFQEISSH